jgi:hypothetical protein
MRFKQGFLSKVGVTVLAGTLAACAPVGESEDDRIFNSANMDAIVKDDPICATVKNLARPSNDGQRYLSALFHKNGIVLSAEDPANDRFKTCLTRQLKSSIGVYDHAQDRLDINAGSQIGIPERLIATKHEMHHREQFQSGIDFYASGNVSPYQRLVLAFCMEADARIDSIVTAYQQKQAGHNDGYNYLMQDDFNTPMMDAYERSLKTNPDETIAMRAAFNAFLENKFALYRYGKDLMPRFKVLYPFNPAEPEKKLLTNVTFSALAEHPGLGNYMDAALRKHLQAFADYLEANGRRVQLSEARQQNSELVLSP